MSAAGVDEPAVRRSRTGFKLCGGERDEHRATQHNDPGEVELAPHASPELESADDYKHQESHKSTGTERTGGESQDAEGGSSRHVE